MSPTPTDPNQAQAWISGEAPDQTIDFYIPRGNTGLMGPQGPVGPSLSVGTVETVVGPAAPGTVGPQGLPGPKGDPGGFVAATSLSGSPNLNDLTTPGTYRNIDNVNASTALNFPLNGVAGNIIVIATGPSIVTQILYPINGAYGSRMHWIRSYNATWTPWRVFNSVRVDTSVGRAIYQWDDQSQREQLVYGDTGWRDVKAGITAPATVGNMMIRRVGQLVTVTFSGLDCVSTQDIYPLPVGFRNSNFGDGSAIRAGLAASIDATPAIRTVSPWSNLLRIINPPVGGVILNGTTSWFTSESWPTTLPGNAVGSIPNL